MGHIKQVVALISLLGCSVLAPAVFAEVQVIDLTQQSDAGTQTSGLPVSERSTASNLSLEQRMAILERQIQHITKSNEQIEQLQRELQKLHGQLEVQKHSVDQLTEQMRTQYQDLDQRLARDTHSADKDLSSVGRVATETPSQAPARANTATAVAKPGIAAAASPDANKAKPVEVASSLAPGLSDRAADEQRLYQTAYNYLRNRDYVRANTTLQAFLAKYPEGDYTPNAHYWLGEIFLIQGQPDSAVKELSTVISQYPTNSKVPDAMLKLGFAYYDKGDFERARVELLKVGARFPNTTTAQLANAKLQQIKQQQSSVAARSQKIAGK